MPEIAEVSRVVHFLRLHLAGKRIATATAIDDPNVFGKVGTSGAAVESTLKGRKVVSVGSQGKYFWITFDKPPHLVMHLGMTGWVHIKGVRTAYTNYYKRMKPEDLDKWPPKFWKFQFTTEGSSKTEVAFEDARRFGRVRLVDCPGEEIRKYSPLKENGPDPVVDKDVFTEEYLRNKMLARHVPVKALLLDQTMISGIGNWVADETLFHAKMHPEQYSDEFSESEIKKLHASVRYICQTAVDKLGDSDQFPDDWLFSYRWGKKDGDKNLKLANGEKLAFITVGGRTSCYAPGLQKKTGKIPPNVEVKIIKPENGGEPEPRKQKEQQKSKAKEPEPEKTGKKPPKSRPGPGDSETKRAAKKRKMSKTDDGDKDGNRAKVATAVKSEDADGVANGSQTGRRRSTRLRTSGPQ